MTAQEVMSMDIGNVPVGAVVVVAVLVWIFK